ncbi:hypothetical protein Ahy_B03g062831 isoform B [Arachis hypogaea]|uniref:Uncharacterized protein n=1 Tax=Arachis hypogaea TaxID=3818 RepID=A0A444ZVK4_ARAHY|nr:hypothetical protein Ahy_B03g062831 isoform B [Arachis hypogaea]
MELACMDIAGVYYFALFVSCCVIMGESKFTIKIHHGEKFFDTRHELEYLDGVVVKDLHYELD